MRETDIMNAILVALSKTKICKMFRNNVGTGWQGERIPLSNNRIIIANPRVLNAGLHKGSSDLIGWTTVTVTPEMVGKPVAVFTSVEVKVPGRKPRPDQQNWINQVKAAGGFAGYATDEASAIQIIT